MNKIPELYSKICCSCFLFLLLALSSFGQDQQIKSFKKFAGNLADIVVFQAKRSDISLLPDSIPLMTSLTQLNLNNTRLAYWRMEEVTEFPAITYFSAERNKLETLPSWICDLTTLKVLKLGNNELETLPDCICKLTELETIDLWGNNIYRLPDCMHRMPNLKIVDMTAMQYNILEQEDFLYRFPNIEFKFSEPCDCEFDQPAAE